MIRIVSENRTPQMNAQSSVLLAAIGKAIYQNPTPFKMLLDDYGLSGERNKKGEKNEPVQNIADGIVKGLGLTNNDFNADLSAVLSEVLDNDSLDSINGRLTEQNFMPVLAGAVSGISRAIAKAGSGAREISTQEEAKAILIQNAMAAELASQQKARERAKKENQRKYLLIGIGAIGLVGAVYFWRKNK